MFHPTNIKKTVKWNYILITLYIWRTCRLVDKIDHEKKITTKQWINSLVFPSPTASKVANTGAKKPYPAPPTILPIMPTRGHRTKRTDMTTQVTSFRIGPSCLVLPSTKKSWENKLLNDKGLKNYVSIEQYMIWNTRLPYYTVICPDWVGKPEPKDDGRISNCHDEAHNRAK